MRVILLGTGTSTGVPTIGCRCAVCTSPNPKNKRLRPSAYVQVNDVSFLIDTSPDLREQALRSGIRQIDAVLYTHTHADHLHGIDDLRVFNFIQWGSIPIFGSESTISHIVSTFKYIFDGKTSEGGGKPALKPCFISGDFDVKGVKVEPLDVYHGSLKIIAYKIGQFAYLTDVSSVPQDVVEKLKGVEVLVIDALRFEKHPTHMNVEQAVKAAGEIAAKRTILTHFSHNVDHDDLAEKLPQGIEPGYDGMEIIIN